MSKVLGPIPYREPDGWLDMRDPQGQTVEKLAYWNPPVPTDWTPKPAPDIAALVNQGEEIPF